MPRYDGPREPALIPHHTWTNGTSSIFRLRGKGYLEDRKKVTPGESYRSDKDDGDCGKSKHIGRHMNTGWFVDSEGGKPKKIPLLDSPTSHMQIDVALEVDITRD